MISAEEQKIPPCAASMGCLCWGHASGDDADAPCDTTERQSEEVKPRRCLADDPPAILEIAPREYRIRIGRQWLKSLVCKPGGAVLADDRAAAGRFTGPSMTANLARCLLDYRKKVWAEPIDGGPGKWV